MFQDLSCVELFYLVRLLFESEYYFPFSYDKMEADGNGSKEEVFALVIRDLNTK